MSVQWDLDHAVLVKVAAMYKATRSDLMAGEVQQHFPAEQHEDVLESLCRLGGRDGHIEIASLRRGDGGVQALRIKGITEKGLRASGAWPDYAELLTDRILEVLAERAEHEPDPKKRSKLEALGGMGRDLIVDVVGTALARLMPGG